MRVLLAGPDFEENLSIRYLASSLQTKRHETSLAVFNSADDVEVVAEQAGEAEIVGLSICFQSRAQEFLTLARRIKQLHPGKLIVAGGHYASCAAQPLLEHHPELDIIVIHEGEQTLVEIVAATANLKDDLPKITGIAYREDDQVRFTPQRRTLDDLDTLPFPERQGRIHTIAGVPTSFLMGSRGCYENCAYCCITTLHNLAPGKKFRQRSVELIADEMAELYRERGTRQFVFHDDNFLVPSVAHNQARIEGFDKAFKSRSMEDIALLIKCRPADANRDVLSRLKEIGLVRIFMGIESATEFLLQGLRLKTELDEFRLPSRTIAAGSASRSRLGRQVAATVLAIGVQAALSTGQGMAEQTPAPMQQAGGDQEKCCTLGGTVTDASGAVVPNASITITNIATNRQIPLTTDKTGQYAAKDLESGKYDVAAQANGFKTTVVKGVEVNAGKAARLDIRLEMGNWGGCCEYAAAPMKTLPTP